MKEGPDIARIAALIGDPARANMLAALMTGKALTASELACEAGITPQTASGHLKKLEAGGLILQRKSGRHRYMTLADEDVAQTLESLMGLAAGRGHLRSRTGPRDPAMRHARVCYNHLAGEMGVRMYQSMQARGFFEATTHGIALSADGTAFVSGLGLDIDTLPRSSAPLCRECLDWSARQSHLAGRLGRALFSLMEEKTWLRRAPGSRTVLFTRKGEDAFEGAFGT